MGVCDLILNLHEKHFSGRYLTYWSLHRRAGAMTVFQIRKVEFSNMNNLNIEPGHLWQEEDTSEEPREGRGGQQQDSGRSFWLDEQKWKWNDCLECLKGSLSSPSCWHREPWGRRCWLSEAGENFNTAFSKKLNWWTFFVSTQPLWLLPFSRSVSAAVTFTHSQKNLIYGS